jgi:uncharacterized MnhB-related membrane protein
MTVYDWIFVILLLGFGLTSVIVLLARKLIVIITTIGLGSVILSIIFFFFDAPIAGAFELSVGAGLISILFIIANSVTDSAVDEVT